MRFLDLTSYTQARVEKMATVALCAGWALNAALLATPHVPIAWVPAGYASLIRLIGLPITLALMLLPIFTGAMIGAAVYMHRPIDRWLVLLAALMGASVAGYASLFNGAFLFNLAIYQFGLALAAYVVLCFYAQYQARAQQDVASPPQTDPPPATTPEKKQRKKKQ